MLSGINDRVTVARSIRGSFAAMTAIRDVNVNARSQKPRDIALFRSNRL